MEPLHAAVNGRSSLRIRPLLPFAIEGLCNLVCLHCYSQDEKEETEKLELEARESHSKTSE
jgi:MoaA/NifB/PqqE/SkfB family radical SAM enzyme